MSSNSLKRYAYFAACCCVITVGYFWLIDQGLKPIDFLHRAFSGTAIGLFLSVPVCLLDFLVRYALKRASVNLDDRISGVLFFVLLLVGAYWTYLINFSCSNGGWCFGI